MSIGIVLALLAVVGWGAGDVFARKALRHIPPATVTLGMAALIVVTLGIAVGLSEGFAVLVALPWYVYALTAVMGFLSHIGGQLLYLQGMQRAGITIASPIIASVPFFAVFLAVVFGGERPSVMTLIGGAIVVAGVMLVVTDRGRIVRL